jgi:hypothetical protein
MKKIIKIIIRWLKSLRSDNNNAGISKESMVAQKKFSHMKRKAKPMKE